MSMKKACKPLINFRQLYDRFDVPMTEVDCGKYCAPHNPSGVPFCCDICHAVPAVYLEEWEYLHAHTDLWHLWRGDECPQDPVNPAELRQDLPEHMLLAGCKGTAHCRREFRALSCRQFPFYPYITSDGDFIGLGYDWFFEKTCWVISHLDWVTPSYRQAFVHVYDDLFAILPDDLESYAIYSALAREYFSTKRRRIPLLHRNGRYALISPGSERIYYI